MRVSSHRLPWPCEIVEQAGALLVGGHSVEAPELKYGLSVTGTVHPDRVVTNAGARPGDRLILTKPLGTGVLATAVKGGMAPASVAAEAVRWMTTLNRAAAEAMGEAGAHACTDVTGFGLLGHALELARASGVTLVIEAERVPLIPGVEDLAMMGLIPAGSFANRAFCEGECRSGRAGSLLITTAASGSPPSGSLRRRPGPPGPDHFVPFFPVEPAMLLRDRGLTHAAKTDQSQSRRR